MTLWKANSVRVFPATLGRLGSLCLGLRRSRWRGSRGDWPSALLTPSVASEALQRAGRRSAVRGKAPRSSETRAPLHEVPIIRQWPPCPARQAVDGSLFIFLFCIFFFPQTNDESPIRLSLDREKTRSLVRAATAAAADAAAARTGS